MKNYERFEQDTRKPHSANRARIVTLLGGVSAMVAIASAGLGGSVFGKDKLCSEETVPVTTASYYESGIDTSTIDGMVRSLSVSPDTNEDEVQKAIEEVLELNELGNASAIQYGQTIDVPVDCGRD